MSASSTARSCARGSTDRGPAAHSAAKVVPLMFSARTRSPLPRAPGRLRAHGRGAFSREGLARAADSGRDRPRRPILEALRESQLPTLVGYGEEDIATPPDHNRRIASRIAGATLVTFDGAGHLSALEAPLAVNAAIVPFVKEHLRKACELRPPGNSPRSELPAVGHSVRRHRAGARHALPDDARRSGLPFIHALFGSVLVERRLARQEPLRPCRAADEAVPVRVPARNQRVFDVRGRRAGELPKMSGLPAAAPAEEVPSPERPGRPGRTLEGAMSVRKTAAVPGCRPARWPSPARLRSTESARSSREARSSPGSRGRSASRSTKPDACARVGEHKRRLRPSGCSWRA